MGPQKSSHTLRSFVGIVNQSFLAAATVLPAAEQILQFRVQAMQSDDLLGDLASLAADFLLQRLAGADPRAPGFQDLAHILQRDLHRLEGADQVQLCKHLLAEQPVAALAAPDRVDQSLFAVEADRLDRQTRTTGDLTDLEGRAAGGEHSSHLTLQQGETA